MLGVDEPILDYGDCVAVARVLIRRFDVLNEA